MAAASEHPEIAALKFRHPWRPYQERVLAAARLHLADRRLHVVSAPGSGKTILGLEMFRVLGAPALVLSPTRIIRDQWIERLRDFAPPGTPWPPPWVSRSLDEPRIFTSITYQALHTRMRADKDEDAEDESADSRQNPTEKAPGKDEIAAVVESMQRAGVKALILDEAHHLRAEWWKALAQIVERIDGLQLISLTATPPYDAIGAEWTRYEELCGSIDEEISVPELVKAGTLSPHQDFVWTVVPSERESEYVANRMADIERTLTELASDDALADAIAAHPWMSAAPDAERVLDAPDTALAMLVLLEARGRVLPPALLMLLDLGVEDIPAIDIEWWQRLLQAWLFETSPDGEPPAIAELRRRIAARLRERNLVHQRQLDLVQSRLVKRYMTQSAAKIDACAEIHRHERRVRGDTLRQVVLTDYIGDGNSGSALGAWPVFGALVRGIEEEAPRRDVALLTGRRVVVHESQRAALGALADELRDDPEIPGFMRATSPDAGWVAALTLLLERGAIRCLVGTRALLGEGWDAPCINSLILASSVGTYVLTNQMRGRAIRTDSRDRGKIASVWHIVAVVLNRPSPLAEMLYPHPALFWPGLADFRELDGRFNTFVGVDAAGEVIENSLRRLDLPYLERHRDRVTGAELVEFRANYFSSAAALTSSNAEMLRRLERLPEVRDAWQASIDSAVIGRVVPSMRTENPPHYPGYFLAHTLTWLLLSALGIALSVLEFLARANAPARLILVAVLVAAGPQLVKAGWLFLRHLPVDGTLHQIGLALRDALCAAGIIQTSARRLRVISSSREGTATVSLEGGTYHEQSLFADGMREILGPVDNPRYLILRKSRMLGVQRVDYHAVPMRVGARKEDTLLFLAAWRKHVGPAELVYTRNAEGRPMLLRARARAFSNAMQRVMPKRIDRWQ